MKKALIAIIALASAWAGVASAGSLVDLAVVNRATGERIPVYAHRGRFYVPGAAGAKYSLVISNKTGERVLAVTSVDGVNVITGETANPAQSGYVLDPWGSVAISGWRKSMSEVAAFVFTSLPDSYAARTDRPGNVGVIGVAVFREYHPPRPPSMSRQEAPQQEEKPPKGEGSSGKPDQEPEPKPKPRPPPKERR